MPSFSAFPFLFLQYKQELEREELTAFIVLCIIPEGILKVDFDAKITCICTRLSYITKSRGEVASTRFLLSAIFHLTFQLQYFLSI